MKIGRVERTKTRRFFAALFFATVILACLVGSTSCEEPATATEPAPASPTPRAETPARVTLAAVGDVIPHNSIKRAAASRDQTDTDGNSLNNMGFDAAFAAVRPQIAKYDLALFNMESPITQQGHSPQGSMMFWAPPGLAGALAGAGFDIAACANNHALDQGQKGLLESLQHLRSAGLKIVGAGENLAAASAGIIVEKKGIRFGILSFTTILNYYQKSMRRQIDKPQVLYWHAWGEQGKEVLDAVRAMRAQPGVDVLLVTVHWDREYVTRPAAYTRKITQQVIDAGADVIIGHHPHVLQTVEYLTAADGRRGLVIYSLGNFISNQAPSQAPLNLNEKRLSAIAELTFTRHANRSVKLDTFSIVPTWIDQQPRCPGEDRPRYRCIRPVIVADEIAALQAALAGADPRHRRQLDLLLRGYEMRLERVRERLEPQLSPEN